MAHLHLLVGVYIPHVWLSRAWRSIGGGKVVDIRYVDVHRVTAYLTPYLAGQKIEHTLGLLPPRARIFTTPRGIQLSEKRKSPGWQLVRKSIILLEFCSKKPTSHRYNDQNIRPPLLIYFEGEINALSIGGQDPLKFRRKRLSRKWPPDGG